VINLLEAFVMREYERLAPTVAGFCGCPVCRDDVLVYALNRLRPHYVAQRPGQIITSVSMDSDQERADAAVVLMDGFRKVKAGPRPEFHPHP
jgi:hypothetical protein